MKITAHELPRKQKTIKNVLFGEPKPTCVERVERVVSRVYRCRINTRTSVLRIVLLANVALVRR